MTANDTTPGIRENVTDAEDDSQPLDEVRMTMPAAATADIELHTTVEDDVDLSVEPVRERDTAAAATLVAHLDSATVRLTVDEADALAAADALVQAVEVPPLER